MFEAISPPLYTQPEHGGFVLLESFGFQKNKLTIQCRAGGNSDGLKMLFEDVIGLTMAEDVFGSGGGQITHEDLAKEDCDVPTMPRGWFWSSSSSPSLQTVRDAVPPPFSDTIEHHKQFLMSQREHELSFVAKGIFDVDPMSFDMAS